MRKFLNWLLLEVVLGALGVGLLFTLSVILHVTDVLGFPWPQESRGPDGDFKPELLLDYFQNYAVALSAAVALSIAENPFRTIGLLALACFVAALPSLLWRYRSSVLLPFAVVRAFFRTVRIYRSEFADIVDNHRVRRLLLHKTGLFGLWPNADTIDRASDWTDMRKRIYGGNQSRFDYLGATGWDTFANEDAPLHTLFKTFENKIRVILMDPESLFLEDRAYEVNMRPMDYRDEIIKSIDFLTWLHRAGPARVELKLYSAPPNWKMVISTQTLWLQRYRRSNHVEGCPVYMFNGTDRTSDALYNAFADEFERIWLLSPTWSFETGTLQNDGYDHVPRDPNA